MKDFGGKLAVITGGGSGMGRELARQLVAEGCDVAMCDVSTENMTETQRLCEDEAPQGIVVSTFQADVSDEEQVGLFRDYVGEHHDTTRINLLFNNAGIAGGGSFVNNERSEWDKVFGVCWNGVYFCTRAFMPMLLEADEGHIVNTSSVNGFWASLGPQTSHTAYSAAKFAVKGFTEALVNDLRNNAPHIKASVVMPGHIGTSIVTNTNVVLGKPNAEGLTSEDLSRARKRLTGRGLPADDMSDDQIREAIAQIAVNFRDNAPTSAAEAATIILDGVREERWRILVGDDAHAIDRLVRGAPEEAYEEGFMDELRDEAGWAVGR
jgi:NAD(P)-dependent dehydrogenase (short-subunit alcohol dehydrogenase family)